MIKLNLFLIPIAIFALLGCQKTQKQETALLADADSIILDAQKYQGTEVITEGKVVHICGVDYRKIKLKTERGGIIKVIPGDPLFKYDKTLMGKWVRVKGILDVDTLSRGDMIQTKQEKILTCHVDHKPCKDTAWVKRQIKSGYADTLLKRDFEKLSSTMDKTGVDYIPIIIIYSEHLEVIPKQ
jgi:hypothetical protein